MLLRRDRRRVVGRVLILGGRDGQSPWLLLLLFAAFGAGAALLFRTAGDNLRPVCLRLEPRGVLSRTRPGPTGSQRMIWRRDEIAGVLLRKGRPQLRLRGGREVALLPRFRPDEQEVLGEVFAALEAWLGKNRG